MAEENDTAAAPDTAAVPAVDPAAASAASDPLPGTRRRGRPKGSKTKVRRTPAQIEAAKANLAKGRVTATAKAGPTDAQLREAVGQLYAMTGMGVAFLDQEIGQAVAACAESAADAWLHMAQQSPAVRRVLVSLTTASATGELIMAHAPLLAVVTTRIQRRNAPSAPGPVDAPGAGPVNGTGPAFPFAAQPV